MNKSILVGLGLTLVIAVLLFRQCGISNGTDGTAVIPASTSLVASLNLQQLISDFNTDEDFDGKEWVSWLKEDQSGRPQDPIYTRIIDQPLKSGLNFNQKIYYGLNYDTSANNQFGFLVMVLSDADQFESEVIAPLGHKVIHKSKYSYTILDKLTIAAWNQSHLIIGASSHIVDLEKEAATLFSTSQESSIATSNTFREIDKGGHSIALWINAGDFKNAGELFRSMGLPEFRPSVLDGLYPTGYLDFKKGSMKGLFSFNGSDEKSIEFSNIFLNKDRSKLYKYLPEEHNVMRATTVFNVPAIAESKLSDENVKKAISNLVGKFNLTLNDVYRTIGGEVFFALYRDSEYIKPTLVCGIKYYNRQIFDTMLDIFIEAEYLVPDEGVEDSYIVKDIKQDSSMYYISFPDGHPRIFIHDSLLFYTGNYNYMAKVKRGGFSKSELYADAEVKRLNSNLLDFYYEGGLSSSQGSKLNQIISSVDLSFSNEKLEVNLQFANKESNALKQLLIMR